MSGKIKEKVTVQYKDVRTRVKPTNYKEMKNAVEEAFEISLEEYKMEYYDEENKEWFLIKSDDDVDDIPLKGKVRIVPKKKESKQII